MSYTLRDGGSRNAYSYAVDRSDDAIIEYLAGLGCSVPGKSDEEVDVEASECSDSSHSEAVVQHLARLLGPVDQEAANEILPSLGNASVSVNFIQPTEKHQYLTLFSTGPGAVPLSIPDGKAGFEHAEYILHLPHSWHHPRTSGAEWEWPVLYFKQIAMLAHLKDAWLGPGIIAAIELPESAPPTVDLTHVLLTPELVAPAEGPHGEIVHLYTVVPMTSEAQAIGAKGGAAAVVNAVKRGKLDITGAWGKLM